jgi:hypothetical protein
MFFKALISMVFTVGFRVGGSALAILLSLTCSKVESQELFNSTVTSNGVTTSQSYSNSIDFIDQTTTSFGLADINPAYTPTSTALVLGDFRGVGFSLTYPTTGSTLIFQIPALGISETFAEANRGLSEDALDTYLSNNGDDILTRIAALLVSTTATDPVAGNPQSLQGTMISSDFGIGTGFGGIGDVRADGDGSSGEGSGRGVFGLAARLGRFSAGGADGTTIELPLSYVRPLADPRWALVVEAPLTFTDIEGSTSYSGSLGGGVRIPILDQWSITPTLRIGAVGSEDLGAAAFMYSANVTSSFRFSVGDLDFNLGNMLSYVASTGSPSVEDSLNYELQNTATRNGLSATGKIGRQIFGEEAVWEAFIVNTQIFGDAVYVDNYTDLAISFGTQRSQNGLTWDAARLGLTYTIGSGDFKRFNLNFGYQF